MIKRMVGMLIVVGIIFGGIFGYKAFSRAMMMKYMTGGEVPPVTVSSMIVSVQPWQPMIRSVGTLRAVSGVDVASEVSGIMESVEVKSGEEVKAGQVLFRMNMDADQAQLRALEASALLARTVYERNKKQFQIQAVSQVVVDGDEAELKVREALVAQQKAMIEKKIIRAPFQGKAGVTHVNRGQYVNPGEKLGTIQDIDPLYVDFFVPQQELARIRTGQKVEVSVDAFAGRVFEGSITAINAKVEADSRNVKIEAVIRNLDRVLLPGMFVSLEVEAGEVGQHITVPQSAITFNPYGATVYLVEKKSVEGKDRVLVARQAFVRTGETRGDQVIVLEGLKAGDEIVTAGQIKLKNGSVLVIDNKVQPANDPAPRPVD